MIIYELMTLREPYDDCLSMGEMSDKILNGIQPTIPDAIKSDDKHPYYPFYEIFRHCTDVDPDRRPTMEDLMLIFSEMPIPDSSADNLALLSRPASPVPSRPASPVLSSSIDDESDSAIDNVSADAETLTTTPSTDTLTTSTDGVVTGATPTGEPTAADIDSLDTVAATTTTTSADQDASCADDPRRISCPRRVSQTQATIVRPLALNTMSAKESEACPTVRPDQAPVAEAHSRSRRPTISLPAPVVIPQLSLAPPVVHAASTEPASGQSSPNEEAHSLLLADESGSQ
jgi:serine/threonine protein kinase